MTNSKTAKDIEANQDSKNGLARQKVIRALLEKTSKQASVFTHEKLVKARHEGHKY